MKNTFETGKTYQVRSICDYDCIFSYTVISRTAKFITIKVMNEIKKVKVFNYEESEACYPQGKYSMSPMLKAI